MEKFFKNKKNQRGISLIWIVVTIAIIGILVKIVVSPLSSGKKIQILKTTTETSIALLNQARTRTLASDDASVYGVHIETGRIVLFKGSTFTEPSVYNNVITMPPEVAIASISLQGGGSDVVFKRLTGDTDYYGSFEIQVVGNTSTKRTVTIKKTGVVSSN